MSSTNRGAERDADDHYATPPEVARLICETLKRDGWVKNPSRLLEPGCGEGSFLDAMAQVWPKAERIGVDINPDLVDIAIDRGHEAYTCNYLKVKDLGGPFDATIGNPPFIIAEAFIERSLKAITPDGVVAMLQKLNFQGGQKRYRTFWSRMRHLLAHEYVLPERVGFTPDGGTDSIEYGIYIFKPDWDGKATTKSFIDNLGIRNKWKGEAWHWRRSKVTA